MRAFKVHRCDIPGCWCFTSTSGHPYHGKHKAIRAKAPRDERGRQVSGGTSVSEFETRNKHAYYDTDTHRVVPKDAVVLAEWERELLLAQNAAETKVVPKDAVVLDIKDPEQIVSGLREAADTFYVALFAQKVRDVADQIEAQTKPSRIPEPGLFGVVEAVANGERKKLVRFTLDERLYQWSDDMVSWHRWDDLINPVLIREGVES